MFKHKAGWKKWGIPRENHFRFISDSAFAVSQMYRFLIEQIESFQNSVSASMYLSSMQFSPVPPLGSSSDQDV